MIQRKKEIFQLIEREEIEELEKILSQSPDDLHLTFGKDKITPLMVAIIKNKLLSVNFFLTHNIGIKLVDRMQKNPLHYAFSEPCSIEITKALLSSEELDIRALDKKKRTILHRGTIKGDVEQLKLLREQSNFSDIINIQDFTGSTALHLAIRYHKENVEEFLLSLEGIDVNIVDKKGRTPLHFACYEASLNSVKRLVQCNINVNAIDNKGNSALHYACTKKCPEIVKQLVSSGADVNLENTDGETPLHMSLNISDDISAHILVNSGADVSVRYDAKYLERRKAELKKKLLNKNGVQNSIEMSTMDDESSMEEINFNNTNVEDPTQFKVDNFGFIKDEKVDSEEQSNDQQKKLLKEQQLTKKWIKVFKKWNKYENKREKIEKLVYKGVPNMVRPQVWIFLSDVESIKKKYGYTYQSLLEKKVSAKILKQIDVDINRSSRNHIMFKERYGQGQVSLFNVLKAYGAHNPSLGYCQSMSDIAAFMLKYIPEEETFWYLVKLLEHNKFQFQGRYIEGFPFLKRCFYIHDKLMEKFVPKLYSRIHSNSLGPELYTFKFYMKPFIDVFPFDMVLRAWDAFLLEGSDFLYNLAITLFIYYEKILLEEDDETFLLKLTSINCLPENISIEKWISDSKELKIKMTLLRALELEYDNVKSEEK